MPKCGAGDACPKVHIAGRDAKWIMGKFHNAGVAAAHAELASYILRRSRASKIPQMSIRRRGICCRGSTCDFRHASSESFLDVSADIGSDGE
jgi:hypothetical protein